MMETSLNPPDQEGLRMCDLVMKGGITSGVVYPPAVMELKEYYRFRHIGGTSAGAIAAAFTAAAEFNREKEGFNRLKELSDWLGQDDNLRSLFQPSEDTKPLMDIVNVLLDGPQKVDSQSSGTGSTIAAGNSISNVGGASSKVNKPGSLRKLFQFARKLAPVWRKSSPSYKRGAKWGMLLGIPVALLLYLIPFIIVLIVSLIIAPADAPRNAFVFLISALVLGIIITMSGGRLVGGPLMGMVGVIEILTKTMPQSFYGICPGHTVGVESPNVLTDWLHAGIEKVAGPDHQSPLTFGQLRKKGIELLMVTSNLSHGQPYIMPSGLQNFVFKEEDMHALFPEDIVKHMIKYPHTNTLIPRDKLPEG